MQDIPGLVDHSPAHRTSRLSIDLACMFHCGGSLAKALHWTGPAWTSQTYALASFPGPIKPVSNRAHQPVNPNQTVSDFVTYGNPLTVTSAVTRSGSHPAAEDMCFFLHHLPAMSRVQHNETRFKRPPSNYCLPDN